MAVIQHSVVFIYSKNELDENETPLATGFLIRISSKTNKESFLEFLVTARHVVEPGWHSCSSDVRRRLFLRLNTANYDPASGQSGIGFEPLDLMLDGKKLYFVHSDPAIDLALVLLTPQNLPNLIAYGYQGIPLTALAKPSEIRVGMPVFSLSLVQGFTGTQRNYPIYREGSLASMPTEQFPLGVDCEGRPQTTKAWLLTSHLDPGSSGSPIFLDAPNLPLLLGIQSFIMQREERKDGRAQTLYYDVAGFTPAPYLLQIIQSMNLRDADLSEGSH